MSLLEMKHIKKEFGGMPVIRGYFAFCGAGRDSGDHRTVRFRQVYAAPLCDDAGDDR